MITLLLMACASTPSPPVAASAEPPTAALDPRAVAGVSDPTLRRLLDAHWRTLLAHSPQWATQLGYREHDDELAPATREARQAWHRARDGFLDRARELDLAELDDADAITLQLFLAGLESDRATQVCREHEWSVGPRFNVLVMANELWRDFPQLDPAAGQALLTRYRLLPARIAQETANLRLGLGSGRVPSAETLGRAITMIRAELEREELELLAPTREPLEGWDAAEAEAWRAELTAVVHAGVLPALAEHLAFLEGELLPVARGPDAVGVGHLPDGPACYDALVRRYTTLPLTADQVHQRGLDAMQTVHAEFREIGARALGTDDLQEIFTHLRTAPELRFETSDQVLAKAEEALARAQAALPDIVDAATPATPCEVEAMPAYEAPWAYIAYYRPPTQGQPGTYVVNTYAPETRPRHEAQVLAFHEAVPGHHLQLAAAQEQGELPAFRRYDGFDAFVEGWALYSERLADEAGLYSSDLDRLGMLSFDAWRAARLVVDTGVHARGWTREQAVAYMVDNTPLALNNIDNEVDRYISWPGQALAYKTGQLEILDLRAQAADALGEDFDLVAFHDLLLAGGGVTMPVLRQRVEAWIQAGGPPAP